MEATRKRQLKKRVKLYNWLATGCIIFFILFFVGSMVIRHNSTADWKQLWIMVVLLTGLLVPLFAGLVLTTFASFTRQQLHRYMLDIRVYRARKFITRVINLIQEDKIQEAVDLYISNKHYPERRLDDYVYGMLIARAQNCSIEKLQKVGLRKMDEVKEDYSPDKISL